MYEMGEKLKKLRRDKKLSQAKVAKVLNLSPSAISSYENFSKLPSIEVLVMLASFYNVSTDYLLGIDNREFICVDGMNDNQKKIILNLVEEFKK